MALASSTNKPGARRLTVTVSGVAGTAVRGKPSTPTTRAADEALQTVLNRLADPTQSVRCVDVETSGLDWRTHSIVGYVVTFSPDPRDSYYVPFRHAGTGNFGGRNGLTTPTGWDGKHAPGEKDLVAALDQPGTTVFGHNLAFDLRFLARVGFRMRPKFEDTIVNEPLLDEYTTYSLEACANRRQVQAKKGRDLYAYMANLLSEKNDKKIMGHFWRLPGDDTQVVEYACGDGTSTWQLRDAQMVEIQAQGLGLVHSVESRLIPVLAQMMVRGVKVDEDRLGGLIGHIDAEVIKLKNEFPSGFNALSPNDVRAWMEQHGHTDWPHTAPSKTRLHGSPSFTSHWLEQYSAGKKIIKLRKWENLNATFCMPLRDRHLWHGRVHTTFNQLRNDEFGTVTGRLSSNEPNMQQVPKHDEELGRLYRSVFVPDFGLWGERDYSQIEPRLMAWYTRAKVFLNDYRNNPKADSHTAVARDARPDWDQMSSSEQKHFRNTWAKRVNQTVITGGGKRALMHRYKMTEGEAQEALNRYFRAVPELKPFQKKAARLFRERGWVRDVLGRRAHLQDPDKDYTAMNRLLQMSNASILKMKMVEVQDYLDSEPQAQVALLLNCHDALSFQFALDDKSRRVYGECKRIMEDFQSDEAVVKIDLPVRVDEGNGPNWSIATYGEDH